MGAGAITAQPGETVELPIILTGSDAAATAVARFRIAYDNDTAVYDPIYGPGGAVDCGVADDLADFVSPGPVFFQPERNRIVVGFGDFQAPVEPFGRDGVVMTCSIAIRPDARAGTYPLFCLGESTASKASGAQISASCIPGTLHITGGSGDANTRLGGRGPITGNQGGQPSLDIAPQAPQADGNSDDAPRGDTKPADKAGGTTTDSTGATGGQVRQGEGTGGTQLPADTDTQGNAGQGRDTLVQDSGAKPVVANSAGMTPKPTAEQVGQATVARSQTPALTATPKKTATVASTHTPTASAGGWGCSAATQGGGLWALGAGCLALLLSRRRC